MTRPSAKVGVYAFTHKKTGKRYIGGSVDIVKRKTWHLHSLRKGKHTCMLLQQAWVRYGEESFTFEILKITLEEDLRLVEQWYMDRTSPRLLLNTKKDSNGKGHRHSEATRANLSKAAKRVGACPEERKRRSERAKRQHAEGRFK